MTLAEILALKGKEQEDAIKALLDSVGKLETQVAGLSKKLTAAEKAGFVKVTVAIGKGKDKKEYEVLSGAKIGGVAYSVEEIANNEEVCAKILNKKEQGILKEITE
jgi:hypothetical protein